MSRQGRSASPSRGLLRGDPSASSSQQAVKRESAVTLLYPQLTRTNYTVWAMKMRVALQAQTLWEAVASGNVDYQKDRMALYAIYQSVPEEVMTSLAGKDTAKSAWDAIKTAHMGHERVREAKLQTLKRDFESLKMEEKESVEEFAGRVTTVVTGIRAMGDNTIDEIAVVRRFLRAAPAHYMQLVTSIEECVDLKTLTVEDLVGRYKAYDERVRVSLGDTNSSEHLLLTRLQWQTLNNEKRRGLDSSARRNPDRGGGRDRGSGGRNDHDEDDEEDDINSQTSERRFRMKKLKCFNCGIRGHFAKDCRKPKKEEALLVTGCSDNEPALL